MRELFKMCQRKAVISKSLLLVRGRLFGFLLPALLLLGSVLAFAQLPAIDDETKKIANQVIADIYYDILAQKSKYPELAQFDETTMFENQQGLYAILYSYKPAENKKSEVYEFGLTVINIDTPIFQEQGQYAFNLQLPVLGLKFAGYFKRTVRGKYFDIMGMINKHGVVLADHQQKYMPLQLSLNTAKTTFTTQESIQFEVELKNVSLKNMWVKEISDATLYCLFNDKSWGTQARGASGTKNLILKSGESIRRQFVGAKLKEPQEIEIYCSYGLSIKGVKPSGILKVKVTE